MAMHQSPQGTSAGKVAAAPAGVSLKQLLKSITDTGVLEGDEVKKVIAGLPPSQQQDASAVVAELERRQRLTRYQAVQLLESNSQALAIGGYLILERLG